MARAAPMTRFSGSSTARKPSPQQSAALRRSHASRRKTIRAPRAFFGIWRPDDEAADDARDPKGGEHRKRTPWFGAGPWALGTCAPSQTELAMTAKVERKRDYSLVGESTRRAIET